VHRYNDWSEHAKVEEIWMAGSAGWVSERMWGLMFCRLDDGHNDDDDNDGDRYTDYEAHLFGVWLLVG